MKRNKNGILFYILLTIFIVAVLFPFYWELVTSLKKTSELFDFNLIPKSITFESYRLAFTARPFGLYVFNSFMIAILTTLYTVTISSFAAYAVARLKFRGKAILMGLVLAVAMFPAISILSPIYLFMKAMGLRNTWLGLIIPYSTFALPIALWNLVAFFKQIPFSLEEAAKIDGATPFQAFTKIILPLVAPGVFTTSILVFIGVINEYLFALTINNQESARTIPVGISMFQGRYTVPWGEVAAATIAVTIPLVIIVLLFQRKIISGLVSGAVKE